MEVFMAIVRDFVDCLNQAQRLASLMDGSDSPKTPGEHRGMGSVQLQFNPYESWWEAKVSWSDGSEIKVEGCPHPEGAVSGVFGLLLKEAPQKVMDQFEPLPQHLKDFFNRH
jgi:hypothetical protein